jgi:dihydroxy-acid dehydratase
MKNRKYSKHLVDGPNQAASRSMLRGAGFTSEDFKKPFVGIASTGAKVTPCNMHINGLADIVEDSISDAGGSRAPRLRRIRRRAHGGAQDNAGDLRSQTA